MSKRFLLIAGNFSPELNGIGKYNGEMIKWLSANGYECTVITTYPYYPEWKVQAPYTQKKYRYSKEILQDNGLKITVYRCPQYVPAKPSGKKRMILDFSFVLSATWKLLQLLPAKKFDFVMAVVPSFHLGLLAILYKQLRGAKFLYHIQDLQIEAARDFNMIRSSWLINIMLSVEKYILSQADIISSISEGMIRKIQEKANKDIILFPNWVDVSQFYPIENRTALKMEYGFKATDKILLYSGAIGEKQGLESILYTAKALQDQDDLKFLICGSGPYKEQLYLQATTLQLSNVIFLPLQPYEYFNRFLNMADIHLVIQKSSASDLVMPSKLTTIMAVGGLALITTNSGSSMYELIQRYKMGILVNADNLQALKEGVNRAITENGKDIARNARAYAETNLSVGQIMSRFTKVVANG
ncbi:colanic acid biosynthesis glycosyl transferase WcaI [Chitinophaga niastensis]|uniref:Colanic acid biosynthesis glycosyl transferase WcaI n=1 Tax=Chitinophaga niastensis TaxID=536980 RepID=A0A2P8HM73_CHINA|nr:WcaI family glycosyltransferase [Chitinophaga niastensis]PSL47313.1 colanic acid biosynthesis glycosyl transferase WcaI [Chitinophaga niastensis]